MRLLAGGECGRVATFEIPEVLIGEVSDLADHNTYTNLRGCAGFFLPAFRLTIALPLPESLTTLFIALGVTISPVAPVRRVV
ncbi:hypothetical protein C5974_02820 [Cronobacter sakazakii]|nr:hypothetical protein C5974_02820 [Cronobacter sakazakii]PRV92481.1 hypothetical protein C6K71_16945 [Cronobacter sakazakii]